MSGREREGGRSFRSFAFLKLYAFNLSSSSLPPPLSLLLSPSSSLPPPLSLLLSGAKDRIVGAHFFSPAHIMPLLEIVKTEHTSKQVRGWLKGISVTVVYSCARAWEGEV